MPKLNEMKLLREALNLKQGPMGELMGIDPETAQSKWQRWEADPEKPSAKKAFEQAKEVYRRETGRAWNKAEHAAPLVDLAAQAIEAIEGRSAALTREEFAEWRGYWKRGMEDVLKRLEHLEGQVQKLSPRGKGG